MEFLRGQGKSSTKKTQKKIDPNETKYLVGSQLRGDQIILVAQKLGKIRLVKKSGQHKGSEIVGDKDARATLTKAYISTSRS